LTYILSLSSFEFFWRSVFFKFFRKSAFRPLGSSKVIDFGTDQKRVCDFLLVRHSNLGAILHRFRDVVGFCAHDSVKLAKKISRLIRQISLRFILELTQT